MKHVNKHSHSCRLIQSVRSRLQSNISPRCKCLQIQDQTNSVRSDGQHRSGFSTFTTLNSFFRVCLAYYEADTEKNFYIPSLLCLHVQRGSPVIHIYPTVTYHTTESAFFFNRRTMNVYSSTINQNNIKNNLQLPSLKNLLEFGARQFDHNI